METDDHTSSPNLHHGFTCLHCKMDPIMGVRYHCQTCGEHNLCSNCYEIQKSEITRDDEMEKESKSSASPSIVHTFEPFTCQQTYERRLQTEIYTLLLTTTDSTSLTQVSMDRFVHLVERLTDYIMDCTLAGNSHHQSPATHIEAIKSNAPTSSSSSASTPTSISVAPSTELLIPQHPHPLTLYEARGPHGFYICDLCLRPANGRTYACAPCKWDAHPDCFAIAGGVDLHPCPIPNPKPNPRVAQSTAVDPARRVGIFFPVGFPIVQFLVDIESMRVGAVYGMDGTPKIILSRHTLHHLLERYHRKQLSHDSTHTPELLRLNDKEEIAILAMVQFVLVSYLESASDVGASTVHLHDILEAMEGNVPLATISKYLHSPFPIDTTLTTDTIVTSHWLHALNESIQIPIPHPFPRRDSYESFLSLRYQLNVDRLRELNSHEWYFNPALVKRYAQEYASLKLPPGDPYFYHRYGLTPIAYYGCFPNLESRAVHTKVDDFRLFSFSILDYFEQPHVFVIDLASQCRGEVGFFGTIRDSTSHIDEPVALFEWHENTPLHESILVHAGWVKTVGQARFMKPGSGADTSRPPKVNVLDPSKHMPIAGIQQTINDFVRMQQTVHNAMVELTPSPPPTVSNFMPSMERPAKLRRLNQEGLATAAALDIHEMDEMKSSATEVVPTSSSSSSSITSSHTPAAPHPGLVTRPTLAPSSEKPYSNQSIQLYDRWHRLAHAIAEGIEAKEESLIDFGGRLNQAIRVAIQLCLFEDFPSHLWTANHPLSVRHYFTQELVREQSRQAGLPDLPNDLLYLIAEYEPARLPFFPPTGAAFNQMRERHLAFLEPNPNPPPNEPLYQPPPGTVLPTPDTDSGEEEDEDEEEGEDEDEEMKDEHDE